MNKFSLVPLVLFTLLILSCDNKYLNETNVFNNYLNDNFHEKIPNDEHKYLLVGEFKCNGCVEKTFLEINKNVKDEKFNSVTIITYDLLIVPDSIENRTKVLLDENAMFERIGLSIANVTLVKTNNSKIVKIKVINLNEIEKVVYEEFN
ncbi:MAG: hypothetical protein B6D64_00895 [Bacteroidetes bacterium 4484_276]|nr:MAG: hypothetical protein B6D64_00895 [Bacteroidetes bacterium 4484_276]